MRVGYHGVNQLLGGYRDEEDRVEQKVVLSDGAEAMVTVDDFTDPWSTAEVALFLHGNAESGAAWYAWVPAFGRRFRLIRPDMRGFGRSTSMREDYRWTLERLVADCVEILDHMQAARVHLIGAKLGANLATGLAALHPERVETLTLVGAPVSLAGLAAGGPPADLVRRHGVEAWARANMASRLGSAMTAEALDYWGRFMGATPVSSQLSFMRDIQAFEVRDLLPRVEAPTLIITAEGSGIATTEQTRQLAARFRDGRVKVIPSDSYHIAVSDADLCASLALEFIATVTAG